MLLLTWGAGLFTGLGAGALDGLVIIDDHDAGDEDVAAVDGVVVVGWVAVEDDDHVGIMLVLTLNILLDC